MAARVRQLAAVTSHGLGDLVFFYASGYQRRFMMRSWATALIDRTTMTGGDAVLQLHHGQFRPALVNGHGVAILSLISTTPTFGISESTALGWVDNVVA